MPEVVVPGGGQEGREGDEGRDTFEEGKGEHVGAAAAHHLRRHCMSRHQYGRAVMRGPKKSFTMPIFLSRGSAEPRAGFSGDTSEGLVGIRKGGGADTLRQGEAEGERASFGEGYKRRGAGGGGRRGIISPGMPVAPPWR